MTEPDTAPLASALRQIREIALQSESDGSALLDMLNLIGDISELGRRAYMGNVRAAQDCELEQLRKLAGR